MRDEASTLPRARDVVAALSAAVVLGLAGFTLARTLSPPGHLAARTAEVAPARAPAGAPARAPAKEEAALPPPGADLLALLGGLAPGDRLDRCKVAAIHGVAQGKAIVVVERDGDTVDLEILRRVEGGPEPPAETERYGVFYRISGAPGRRLAQAMVEGAARALADRIAQHEDEAPAPAGMDGSDALSPTPGKAL